jgi:hypothetical protein
VIDEKPIPNEVVAAYVKETGCPTFAVGGETFTLTVGACPLPLTVTFATDEPDPPLEELALRMAV